MMRGLVDGLGYSLCRRFLFGKVLLIVVMVLAREYRL